MYETPTVAYLGPEPRVLPAAVAAAAAKAAAAVKAVASTSLVKSTGAVNGAARALTQAALS